VSHRKVAAFLRNIGILICVVAVFAGLIYAINHRTKVAGKGGKAGDFSKFLPGSSDRGTGDSPFVAAENQRLKMILDPVSLGITLEDKSTGETMSSVFNPGKDPLNESWKGFLESGVAIEFYNGTSPALERADMFNRSPQKYIKKKENGFQATISYEKLKIAFTVVVELTEDGMTAKVPAESIYEGEQFRLGAVYLYPFMGASRLDEEKGYLFIPEGSGALVELKDNKGRYNAPYAKKIYGENIAVDAEVSQKMNWPSVKPPEQIVMPVFGIAHTDRNMALLGIAEDGTSDAELLAYPNGVMTNYNWVTVKYLYRKEFITQVSRGSGIIAAPKEGSFRDVGVRFIVLSGDQADYSGMAKAYRNYLLKTDRLEKKDTEFRIRLDFLGAESKKWIVFKAKVPMTTVEQMGSMMERLEKKGVDRILPTYMGWQSGGLSLAYGSNNYTVEKSVGDMDQLNGLAARLKKKGSELMLYQDFLLANPDRKYDSSTDIAKNLGKTIAKKKTNKPLYPEFYYLTPPRSLSDSGKFREKFEDTNLHGITVGSNANTLYSYFSRGAVHPREETRNMTDSMMKGFQGYQKAMIRPFDYLWKYTDHYFDLPLATSNYNYISREVPFLPMVLKGILPYYSDYANFEPNRTKFLLKMVEYGAYPSFLLTWEDSTELKDTNSSDFFASKFTDYEPVVKEYYRLFRELHDRIGDAGIQKHEALSEDVVKVVYDNGVEIVVNYGRQDFPYRNATVEPQSYRLFEVN